MEVIESTLHVKRIDLDLYRNDREPIARHKVQLPLYYIFFEIAQLQDLVSSNILLM